jgi:hypothetical protein
MNKLEQYISDRKRQFEEEPPAGHFERMQEKMNRKSIRISVLRWCIPIAASLVIVFLAGNGWQSARKQYDKTMACENAMDMKNCYLNRMYAVADRIEALSMRLDQWDRQQVMTDVQNIIELADSDFDSEIPEELPDNEVKLILSGYYRQSLESLDMIGKKLEMINEKIVEL